VAFNRALHHDLSSTSGYAGRGLADFYQGHLDEAIAGYTRKLSSGGETRWYKLVNDGTKPKPVQRRRSGGCSATPAATALWWMGLFKMAVRAKQSPRSKLFLGGVAACGVELMQVIAREKNLPLQAARVTITGTIDPENPVHSDFRLFNLVGLQFVLKGVNDEQGAQLIRLFTRR
jgi:hypothetical protein